MILNFSFENFEWVERNQQRNRFLFSDDDVVCLCVVHVVLARCILYEYSYNTTYVVTTKKKSKKVSLSLCLRV